MSIQQVAARAEEPVAGSEAPAFHLGHRPALDGVRGVAILLVMCVHGGLLYNGHVGVDVFFALSGFLITAILLEELEQSGRLRLRDFYIRRALRLFPALAAYLLFLTLATLFVPATTIFGQLTYAAPLAAAFYASNWLVVATKEHLALVNITWSLAIEEQFYIAWPFVLLLASRAGLSRRTILLLLAALIAASMAWRWELWQARESIRYAQQYYRSDARMYAILTGCLVALLVSGDAARWLRPRPMLLRLAAPSALVFVSITAASTDGRRAPDWMSLLVPAAVMIIVLDVLNARPTPIARLLATPPLRWIGRLSYSLYLWHLVAFGAVYGGAAGMRDIQLHAPPFAAVVLMWSAAFATAMASYYLVERPGLRMKARFSAVVDPPPGAPDAGGASRDAALAPSAPTAGSAPIAP